MSSQSLTAGRRGFFTTGVLKAFGVLICFSASLALPLRAGENDSRPSETPKRAAQRAPDKPGKKVEVGVEMRWRMELRDNADFRPADDFDAFTGQRIRVNLRARLHPRLSLFVQAQDVWLFGAEKDKVIHDLNTNLHQAYFDWKLNGSERWQFRVGRQELAYGEERLVGPLAWDNVARSFEAARLRNQRGNWTSDILWARLVKVRRGGAPARRGQQDLSGAYFTRAAKNSSGRLEFYGLFLRDGLRTSGEIPTNALGSVRIFTIGFRGSDQPKTGFRYSLENAWQFGERDPDSHRAAMFISTAGYVWDARWQPRLQFEYDFATGDDDPHDGRSREFNNLFPTNHTFYGYADLLGLRNMHDFRFTAAVTVHPKLILETDYHRFLLASPRGPWKDAGGRVLGSDTTGQSGRYLGQEVDLTVRVPLEKHLNFLAGYSAFIPGAFAFRTRGPETQHFGYVQTIVRF